MGGTSMCHFLQGHWTKLCEWLETAYSAGECHIPPRNPYDRKLLMRKMSHFGLWDTYSSRRTQILTSFI